jgi:hypothetical protein
MFSNLGLKLKVFFFMAVILAALSFLNFILFKTFVTKVDLQQGPENSARLVQEVVKNTMHSLINNSFQVGRDLNFTRASRNAPLRVDKIVSPETYAVIDEKGAFITGDFNIMNNFSGVPAVERALKSGFASDGSIKLEDTHYIIGVAPVLKEIKGEGRTLFAVISARRLPVAFKSDMFTAPVRIFIGEKFVNETMSEKWSSMEQSCGSDKMQKTIETLLNDPGSKTINNWTYLHSFMLPADVFEGEKVTIISMTSFLPGWEEYKKVVIFSVLYALAAIVILFFFTFIVTHEIGKVFRRLAADLSRLRVGEKLVLKKYSHGADIAVSALNTLISKYQRQEERDGPSSIGSAPINGTSDERRERKITAEIQADISDPFGTDDVEETPKKPIKALKPEEPKRVVKEPVKSAPPPNYQEEDDEKTQMVQTSSDHNPFEDISGGFSSEEAPKDLFDELWDEYCRIKEKGGELVSDKEKKVFIGKLRTNRASIMARYKCSDVSFAIEEKDGKPVIKAKPLK